jgi:DNA-binding beta-propeller fold protein YncE
MILASTKQNGAAALALALAALAAGCDGGGTTLPIKPAPASGLAVIGNDFTSTVVSLVAADGTLAKADCIDSGTSGGTISMALSGDVTLPSQPQRGGELWLVDRGNAALTVLEPTTCEVRTQKSVASGFRANPHDVAVLSDTKAYVTRYDRNVAATDAMGKGDDIVVIDPATLAITSRIDLAPEATAVTGKDIQARPDRLVIAGGKVYVSLGNQDAMFAAAADGRVVVIDPETDTVSGHVDLPGLRGCSAMFHLAATNTLYVACGGSFADADQAAFSGVAEIDLAATPAALKRTTRASGLDGQAVNFSWVAAVSDTRGFAATFGKFPPMGSTAPGTNDATFAFDPTAHSPTKLPVTAGPFDLGRAALGEGKLFIPDATFDKPVIHVLTVPATGEITEGAALADPAKGMPPREIAWY